MVKRKAERSLRRRSDLSYEIVKLSARAIFFHGVVSRALLRWSLLLSKDALAKPGKFDTPASWIMAKRINVPIRIGRVGFENLVYVAKDL